MPIRSRQFITLKRTYIAIIAMNIFSVLCNVPFTLHFEINDDELIETEFSKSWFFQWFYSMIPDFVFYHALPVILIFCGNIAILVSLRKFNLKRIDLQAAPVTDVKEISMTKIILPIIGLHFLTSLLMVIQNILLYLL